MGGAGGGSSTNGDSVELRLSQIKALQEHQAAGAAAEAAAARARRTSVLGHGGSGNSSSLHMAGTGLGARVEFGAQPVAIAGGRVLSSTKGAIQWQYVGPRDAEGLGDLHGLQLEPESEMVGEHAIDPYSTLGVPVDSPAPEIRARYLQLARQCEPSTGDSDAAAAATSAKVSEFELLSGCYTILSDPFLRAQYDRGEHQLTTSSHYLPWAAPAHAGTTHTAGGSAVARGAADDAPQSPGAAEQEIEPPGQWARDVYHWTRWWRSESDSSSGNEPIDFRGRRGSWTGSDSSVASLGSLSDFGGGGGAAATNNGGISGAVTGRGRRSSLEATPPRGGVYLSVHYVSVLLDEFVLTMIRSVSI